MLAAVCILSGCGGSGAKKAQAPVRVVRGPSFRFEAPRGWSVQGTKASDGSDFVQVASFPLVHDYSPSLFAKVETELAARMATVAQQSGGTVAGHSVVTAAGIKSHSYDVRVGKRTDTYTFVLRGKREYQLLCSASADVCKQLLTSFAVD